MTNEGAGFSIPELFSDDPHADPYAFLGLLPNSDGSFTRHFLPTLPASSHPDSDQPVLTKDFTINQDNKTWARIFLPRQALDNVASSEFTKLPLIVEFHGGGFVTCSLAYALFNDYYTILSTETPAVIVSVDYRLAPEHRLPAAYDDGMEALHVIKNSKEGWLTRYADLSNCFLMGSSAGANLAYNLALRVCSSAEDLRPLCIKGLILHQPYFGGTKRTQSELRLADDKIAPPCVTDIMWDLSLPVGADRDHEYCNPMGGIKTELLDQIKGLGWKVLVKGCDGDPLIDRQIEFCKMLEENGVQVVTKFDEGGFHGLELIAPDKAKAFTHLIKQLLLCNDTFVPNN